MHWEVTAVELLLRFKGRASLWLLETLQELCIAGISNPFQLANNLWNTDTAWWKEPQNGIAGGEGLCAEVAAAAKVNLHSQSEALHQAPPTL